MLTGSLPRRRIAVLLSAVLVVTCGEPMRSSGRRAAFMQIVSGDAQEAVVGTELPTPLVVKVLDSAGAVVSGQIVNFLVVAGGGSVFAGTSISNSAGLAQERWTLGTSTADSQRVEARAVDNVTGVPLTFAVFKAVALPGPSSSVAKVAGDAQSAVVETAVAEPLAVRVADSYGNPVPGITVTFAVASGGGSVAQPAPATNDTGVAMVTAWTLGPIAGTNTLTATVTGLPPVTFTANGTAGSPASVAINAGDNQSAIAGSEVPIPPSVVVKDGHGNVVPGVHVTFAVASGGGSVLSGIPFTNPAGVLAVDFWTLGPTAGTNTLTATVTGLPSVTFTATGVAGPAAVMKASAGDSQSATVGTAVAIRPAVQVTDVNGNPVAGVTVAFTDSGGGSVTGALQTTNASGVAAVGNWTLDTIAGASRLFASSTGLPPVVFQATGTAGPPTSIAKQAGDSQVGVLGTLLGRTLVTPPAVRLKDGYGNPVPNANVTFAVASGGGTISGGAATSDADGMAAVGSWIVGSTVGANTLTATVAGLPFVTFMATATRFTVLSPGGEHTCAIGTGNAAYCWGANGFGELGDSTNVDRLTPIAVLGGVSFTSISAGYYHTCGLTSIGAAYCWGKNDLGQFGNGTTDNSSTPAPAGGGLSLSSLSAAWWHTCALTSAGAAYCWGRNDDGELGDGTTTSRTNPVTVQGGLTFTTLSVGAFHTCGLTSAGAAYCWGGNFYGQLGDGTSISRSSPTPVSGGTTFVAISTGWGHTCGLTTAGVLLCWGVNASGELGNGTMTDSVQAPAPVVGGLSFVQVTAGDTFTCGLTTATTSYCWGQNGVGQLGTGVFTTAPPYGFDIPQQVSGGLTFTVLAAGNLQACGLIAGGSAYCWGYNHNGGVGDGTNVNRSAPTVVR